MNYSNRTCYIPREGEHIRFYNDGNEIHEQQHREEMKAIANQIAIQRIRELVPQIAKEIYQQSLQDMLKGLKYDIDTIVNISFDDGRSIFNSSKARKAVSDAIYNEIVKGLNDITLKF